MRTTDPLVTKYFKTFQTLNPLSKKEEHQLFCRWKNKKDKKAFDKLILHNLKFVVRQANKFSWGCNDKTITITDLIQAGNEGLIEAVNHFKPSKNTKLVSYAVHWINSRIKTFIQKNVSTVHLPQSTLTKSLIDRRGETFSILNNRDSAVLKKWENKIQKKFHVSKQTLKNEEQKIATIFNQFSLDNDKVPGMDGEVNWHNVIPSEFNLVKKYEEKNKQEILKEKIKNAMKCLNERERDIIQSRIMLDDEDSLTLSVVGKKYNISRERIRQVQEIALTKLRLSLENDSTIKEIVECS